MAHFLKVQDVARGSLLLLVDSALARVHHISIVIHQVAHNYLRLG